MEPIIMKDAARKEEKIYGMLFSKVYPLLVAKAERKGRSREEVDTVTCWLTGYKIEDINQFLESDLTYGAFFTEAPAMNPERKKIKGKICGVDIPSISDPLMQDIRYLDKLVDELAKGKAMEKILNR